MKLKSLSTIASLMSLPGVTFGAAVVYDEVIWTTSISPFAYGTSVFREIDSDTTNLFGAPEFQGANLGIFTLGSELYLTGQQKSFKDNGTDVTGHSLFWSLDGGATFASIAYGFQPTPLSGGNQQWGADNTGTLTGNILTGLSPGSYTLSVWSTVTTDGVNAATTIFNTNGGSNYNASFTVVPEPASAVLGLLGVVLLLRRRK